MEGCCVCVSSSIWDVQHISSAVGLQISAGTALIAQWRWRFWAASTRRIRLATCGTSATIPTSPPLSAVLSCLICRPAASASADVGAPRRKYDRDRSCSLTVPLLHVMRSSTSFSVRLSSFE